MSFLCAPLWKARLSLFDWVLIHIDKVLLNPHFFNLNNLSSLSATLWVFLSCDHFHGPVLEFVHLLYWEAQDWWWEWLILVCINSGSCHLPLPAGKAFTSAFWEAVGLCFMGTVLTHVQFLVCQDPVALLCRAASSCSPAYAGAWGSFSPNTGLETSLSWTSWGSCWLISPGCWGPLEWQHTHLV